MTSTVPESATEIRPFSVEVSEEELADLRRRIAATLDNITMTWVTNMGMSSGRLYWENSLGFFDVKGVTVPAAVSVFPNELSGASELGREGLPQPHLFQRGRRGQSLCGLAGAGALHGRGRAAFKSLR